MILINHSTIVMGHNVPYINNHSSNENWPYYYNYHVFKKMAQVKASEWLLRPQDASHINMSIDAHTRHFNFRLIYFSCQPLALARTMWIMATGETTNNSRTWPVVSSTGNKSIKISVVGLVEMDRGTQIDLLIMHRGGTVLSQLVIFIYFISSTTVTFSRWVGVSHHDIVETDKACGRRATNHLNFVSFSISEEFSKWMQSWQYS